MDSQYFDNKLTQVREHLVPFRERLENAAKTAPTDELKKMAADLVVSLQQSFDACAAEIKYLVNIHADEQAKVEQAFNDAKAAAEAARKRASESPPAPAAPSPTLIDPTVLEKVKRQLLVHVGIIAVEAPSAGARSFHFSDWVNESSASAPLSNAGTSETSAATMGAAANAAARFDSWLQESIRSVSGNSAAGPIPALNADPDREQREWEKMLGQ